MHPEQTLTNIYVAYVYNGHGMNRPLQSKNASYFCTNEKTCSDNLDALKEVS